MFLIDVKSRVGHPWNPDNRPNFDIMQIFTDNQNELTGFISDAESKFWKIWMGGSEVSTEEVLTKDGIEFEATHGVVLFKPSGITSDWDDSPENPHPGGDNKRVDELIDSIKELVNDLENGVLFKEDFSEEVRAELIALL